MTERAALLGRAGGMTALPPEIFDGCTAILGRVGSGKSYAARGLVETWLEQGRRVCIIDPTDVWYGLRSNAAGDGPGYPVVVFGGDHGDVPIGDRSGERVAEIIASRNMPAVICTAEMTGGARHRFMTDFLGTLYRGNRKPLHLVVDEADDIAPQQPLPENRRMLGDMDRIVRRGRVRGFRVLMISQRPAVLNKNVLSMASVLIAMRLPGPQDRKAIDAWITGQAAGDEGANVMASLPGLQRGEGWVWAPENGVLQRTQFPLVQTFDSMRTPEIDEEVIKPTGLAAVELGDLAALLAPDEDDAHSDEAPKSYGAEIAAAEQRGYQRGYQRGVAEGLDQRREMEAAMQAALGYLVRYVKREGGIGIVDVRPAPAPPIIDAEPVREALPKPKGPKAAPAPGNGSLLPVSAQKMLRVLARGLKLTWGQCATLAGLKARGGSYNTGRKALRDGGYILEETDGIMASAKGIKLAGGAQPRPSTPAELLAFWRTALPSNPGRMLDELCRQGGKWVSKGILAELLGVQPRGGSWNTAISMLRNNRLIEVKDDQLRASAELRG